MTWRGATREEIYRYYTEEFPHRIDDLPSFITPTGPKEFGVAFQQAYPIKKEDAPDRDFVRRQMWTNDRENERGQPCFLTVDDLVRFIQHPARYDPLRRTSYGLVDPDVIDEPEPFAAGVYYAADHWNRPWLLFVDIDAKDVARIRALEQVDDDGYENREELLRKSGVLSAEPAGYPYTFEDIQRSLEYGFEVTSIFESDFEADETLVVYTGQGVHVYLLDTDAQHRYDAKSREVLNDLLVEEYGIPIDPVVTADRRRLARLPYSLHSGVCRVVQPIETPQFDFQREAQPEFLHAHA